MGAEFLVNSALFCIFIFFCPRTSNFYVCQPFFFNSRRASQPRGSRTKTCNFVDGEIAFLAKFSSLYTVFSFPKLCRTFFTRDRTLMNHVCKQFLGKNTALFLFVSFEKTCQNSGFVHLETLLKSTRPYLCLEPVMKHSTSFLTHNLEHILFALQVIL